MDKKKKISIWYIVKYVFLFGMLLFALVPLLQVFINSFRSDREVKTMPLGLPKQWVFNNYPETWQIGGYGQAYINSLLIAAVVIVVVWQWPVWGLILLASWNTREEDFLMLISSWQFLCLDFSISYRITLSLTNFI